MAPEHPVIETPRARYSLPTATIFEVFAATDRRKLLYSLAREPWRAPSDLKQTIGCTLDGTMKRMLSMRSKRILGAKGDPNDQRRLLYALSPEMCLVGQGNARMFDFGYLKVPFDIAVAAEETGVEIGGVRWMPDVVFRAICDPTRRKLLAKLARTPAQTGAQLDGTGGIQLTKTLKHLAALRTAGFVIVPDIDSGDGRRQLYSLAPNLPIKVHDSAAVLDFGFCSVTVC